MKDTCLKILFVLMLLSAALCCRAAADVDSVLRVLDSEIALAPGRYIAPKEERLGRLRRLYAEAQGSAERFEAARHLFDEYKFYQYDSAYSYARRMEAIAAAGSPTVRTMQARAALVSCFSSVGFFYEALGMLGSVDASLLPPQERIEFYMLSAKLNQNIESFVAGSSDISRKYKDERVRLYRAILDIAHPDGYEYSLARLELERLLRPDAARTVDSCKALLARYDIDNHQKAINCSTIGLSYLALGQTDSAICYLARSAVHDLRSNTRETTAAKDLATIMYHRGEVERAMRYIQQALDDAEGYNCRFRKVEINSIMPLIERERHLRLSEQRLLLSISSAIFFVMLTAMIFLFFKLRRRNRSLTESHREIREKTQALEASNGALAEVNTQLREATEIKDQYIIQTLYSNTDFVNEVDEKSRRALLKLKGKQWGEVGTILSDMGVRREQARMYASFDSAFLKLFPNFEAEFDRLLQPGHGIRITDGRMPTEMRIFALMRLGITAPADIARYLCLSVNTVYVYKTKVKNHAAIDKNDFDRAVMSIPKP